ncbi:YugN-like family protein [Bacillus sp. CLL-7-23]|uniref:YugN-like family protein n=1 Tax=Bacillus changyiensis TaxID=3004103 RepID=A0ABT4X720_9BACI|nr:YugN-like family protein [Bacillus changyiensis]MDA7028083.1 YugN-like family protein [Bacillus changyiensis]
MKIIPFELENDSFPFDDLEKRLKPLGYSLNGGWEYDHGFFDYKIDDTAGYLYLRLPFTVEEGQLDSENAIVKLGQPFLLRHVYQEGLDDHVVQGNVRAAFDQFAEPEDKDAAIPNLYIELGHSCVKELEKALK